MSLTYSYNKDQKPVAKIQIVAETRGGFRTSDPIEITVDTGASHITLPESLLSNAFGYISKSKVPGSTAGVRTTIDIAKLNCRILFLDKDGEVVYTGNQEQLTFALRETKLLGRNVIDGQIYEFNGRAGTLTISFHST